MRAFAFGVIVGAIVCFGAVRLIDREVHRRAEPGQQPVDLSASAGGAGSQPASRDFGDMRSASPARTDISTAGPRAPARSPHPVPVDSQASTDTQCTVEQLRASMQDISEKDANALCFHASNIREQRERAKKAAEPKDAGWAYPMEQLLRQHIETHARPDQFTKVRVECRTTFCELEMEGRTTEGRELAERVAHSIPQQPWSDIVSAGQSSTTEGDDWSAEYEWRRLQTEEDRRAWRLLQDQP